MEVDDLTPEAVERLRRSISMLTRGQPGLDREAAMTVLEDCSASSKVYGPVLTQVEELLHAEHE